MKIKGASISIVEKVYVSSSSAQSNEITFISQFSIRKEVIKETVPLQYRKIW